jgi:hypothetical protein
VSCGIVDGTTHMIFEPLELVEKLAALVPPPKFNLIRYHGVLAPSAAFRPLIIPESRADAPHYHPGCPGVKQSLTAPKRQLEIPMRRSAVSCMLL